MSTVKEKTITMKLERSRQMTIMNYDLNEIVRKDHEMRKVDEIISFNKLALGFKDLDSCKGRQVY